MREGKFTLTDESACVGAVDGVDGPPPGGDRSRGAPR